MSESNDGSRFDRLPAREENRTVEGRPTSAEVVSFFDERFGIDAPLLSEYTFWEKGKGKIWALRADIASPVPVEALGIHVLRTRNRFWKPTTDGMQLLGRGATKNVIEASPSVAARFWAGETQSIEADVEDGYVIVSQALIEDFEPLGVGLYVDGELRSMVPKSRQLELDPLAAETDR